MKLGPNTKPHRGNAGYICEMKAKLGGHIVVYDRAQPNVDIDAGDRWIVMHEPSSLHVSVRSLAQAREIMQGVAKATTIEEANGYAQIIPQPGGHAAEADDDGAGVTVKNEKRLAKQKADAAERQAGLDRFLADPENEPSDEGKAGLRAAFGLGRKK